MDPLHIPQKRQFAWFHRYDAARAAIDPETGKRITPSSELTHYQNLVDNSWVVRF